MVLNWYYLPLWHYLAPFAASEGSVTGNTCSFVQQSHGHQACPAECAACPGGMLYTGEVAWQDRSVGWRVQDCSNWRPDRARRD